MPLNVVREPRERVREEVRAVSEHLNAQESRSRGLRVQEYAARPLELSQGDVGAAGKAGVYHAGEGIPHELQLIDWGASALQVQQELPAERQATLQVLPIPVVRASVGLVYGRGLKEHACHASHGSPRSITTSGQGSLRRKRTSVIDISPMEEDRRSLDLLLTDHLSDMRDLIEVHRIESPEGFGTYVLAFNTDSDHHLQLCHKGVEKRITQLKTENGHLGALCWWGMKYKDIPTELDGMATRRVWGREALTPADTLVISYLHDAPGLIRIVRQGPGQYPDGGQDKPEVVYAVQMSIPQQSDEAQQIRADLLRRWQALSNDPKGLGIGWRWYTVVHRPLGFEICAALTHGRVFVNQPADRKKWLRIPARQQGVAAWTPGSLVESVKESIHLARNAELEEGALSSQLAGFVVDLRDPLVPERLRNHPEAQAVLARLPDNEVALHSGCVSKDLLVHLFEDVFLRYAGRQKSTIILPGTTDEPTPHEKALREIRSANLMPVVVVSGQACSIVDLPVLTVALAVGGKA